MTFAEIIEKCGLDKPQYVKNKTHLAKLAIIDL